MRGKLIIAAVLVQLLILGWMAGEREWIVRTAPEVWLRTAPVDPRDLFRGDYVTLGYEISTIHADKFGPGLKKYLGEQDWENYRWSSHEIVIFFALKQDPSTGLATVAAADLTPPPSGIFIKGRARLHGFGSSRTSLTGVAYGIDAYYIQQGRGGEFERRSPLGFPDDVQTPMEMRVAIGSNGTAVLTGHRWCALGIGMTIETTGNSDDPKSKDKLIRVTIRNTSTEPHAVVLPADHRTLRVQLMEGWNGSGIDSGISPANPPPLTDADVRTLKPGECATIVIDLSSCLVKTDETKDPVPLNSLKNDHRYFRVVYTPPTVDECRGLTGAGLVTRECLPGRLFTTYEICH